MALAVPPSLSPSRKPSSPWIGALLLSQTSHLPLHRPLTEQRPQYSRTHVNLDPWTRRRHQNGMFYQSGNGFSHRNFELVCANPKGGIDQLWRDGDSHLWAAGATLVALDSNGKPQPGQFVTGQPSFTGSSFNRDFEVLFCGGVEERSIIGIIARPDPDGISRAR
jgi:hypothetical protein